MTCKCLSCRASQLWIFPSRVSLRTTVLASVCLRLFHLAHIFDFSCFRFNRMHTPPWENTWSAAGPFFARIHCHLRRQIPDPLPGCTSPIAEGSLGHVSILQACSLHPIFPSLVYSTAEFSTSYGSLHTLSARRIEDARQLHLSSMPCIFCVRNEADCREIVSDTRSRADPRVAHRWGHHTEVFATSGTRSEIVCVSHLQSCVNSVWL
jgi:hypothetical protein